MTFQRVAQLVGAALLVMVANVLASVAYMVVYGYVIDPGHEPQYYDEHIQVAAPYCSIVAGMPLMFAAGWWVTGWWQRTLGLRPAWIVWAAYATIDLLVLLAAGLTLKVFGLFAVSFVTKLAAALGGAKVRLGRAVAVGTLRGPPST